MKTINLNHLGLYNPLAYNAIARKATAQQARFSPVVDIFEEDKSYFIRVAVPGLSKEDFRIDLEENRLTISGERKAELNRNYHLQESQFGKFERSFTLPDDVDYEGVEASYEQGLLLLNLPKMEQQIRKIKIKVK